MKDLHKLSHKIIVSFVKIGVMKAMLYLKMQKINLGEIQYKRSAHNAAELIGVLSNVAQVRLYSSYRHK